MVENDSFYDRESEAHAARLRRAKGGEDFVL